MYTHKNDESFSHFSALGLRLEQVGGRDQRLTCLLAPGKGAHLRAHARASTCRRTLAGSAKRAVGRWCRAACCMRGSGVQDRATGARAGRPAHAGNKRVSHLRAGNVAGNRPCQTAWLMRGPRAILYGVVCSLWPRRRLVACGQCP